MPSDIEPILADTIGKLAVIHTFFAQENDRSISSSEARGLAVILREISDSLELIQTEMMTRPQAP